MELKMKRATTTQTAKRTQLVCEMKTESRYSKGMERKSHCVIATEAHIGAFDGGRRLRG